MSSFSVAKTVFELKPQEVAGSHGFIRTLDQKAFATFQSSAFAKRKGVYVFALKGQGGAVTPWYVGLAKKQTLGEEAFTKDKLRKYAAAMFNRTGTPLLMLVVAPVKGPKGPIDDLETLLIWIARARNPKLLNERKTGSKLKDIFTLLKEIKIAGVLNSSAGQPHAAAKKFREMMRLESS